MRQVGLTPRRRRELDSVGDMDTEARIAALESEQRLLRPYATTKDLPKLKARLVEISDALSRLYGLPLE